VIPQLGSAQTLSLLRLLKLCKYDISYLLTGIDMPLRNDIGDILDTVQPSHCICIDCDHFKPSDCSSTCRCCSDRCDELYRNTAEPPYPLSFS